MKFALGLDLGKMQDFTALVVAERREEFKDVLTGAPVRWRPAATSPITTYQIRHLERMIGVPYTQVVDRVDQLMQTPLMWKETDLVVDATGVGMAVVDMLRDRGLEPIPVMITAGNMVKLSEEGVYTVPKRELVMAVALVLESKRIQIIDSPEARILQREMVEFSVKIDAAGHTRFEHREGEHDDLLLGTALAIWWQSRVDVYGELPEPDYQDDWNPLEGTG